MNTTLTLAYWGHTLVWLAIGSAVLFGVAEISQRLTRSAVARRTI